MISCNRTRWGWDSRAPQQRKRARRKIRRTRLRKVIAYLVALVGGGGAALVTTDGSVESRLLAAGGAACGLGCGAGAFTGVCCCFCSTSLVNSDELVSLWALFCIQPSTSDRPRKIPAAHLVILVDRKSVV